MNVVDALRRNDELRDRNVLISIDRDARGERGVIVVKDCLDVAGLPTTAGSVILDPAPRTADAPVVAAARAAGYAIVGKANMHEFAFGVTNVNPHYGSIPNPFDASRIVGGSSGGSAAAVAYGICDWAIGTDSGGSVRIPAALCGVVGIKPSRGLIRANHGMVPLSTSLDSIGPIAGDVATAAHALEVLAQKAPVVRADRPWRVAVPAGWADGVDDVDDAVRLAWDSVRAGLPEIAFPDRRSASKICNTILYAEASAYHRRWYPERKDDYGTDVRRSIEIGREVRACDYLAALDERKRLSNDVEAALAGWDAVAVPTAGCVAPTIDGVNGVDDSLYRFTQPFNVSGHPVVTIPAPVGPGALPVGVQIVGHIGRDWDAIAVAAALEREWRNR